MDTFLLGQRHLHSVRPSTPRGQALGREVRGARRDRTAPHYLQTVCRGRRLAECHGLRTEGDLRVVGNGDLCSACFLQGIEQAVAQTGATGPGWEI